MTLNTAVPNENPATITVEAAARRLGIGRQLAYELARRGELPGAHRLGPRRIVVSRKALERFLESDGGGDPGQNSG